MILLMDHQLDNIYGQMGNDMIKGGDGNDTIRGNDQ